MKYPIYIYTLCLGSFEAVDRRRQQLQGKGKIDRRRQLVLGGEKKIDRRWQLVLRKQENQPSMTTALWRRKIDRRWQLVYGTGVD